MKKLALFLPLFLIAAITLAQVPQALNYQAVARNSMGQAISSQNIGVRFSITDASGGTVYYQEKHTAITNSFGLFSLSIGKGTSTNGTFSTVRWETGDKFLKVEIAPQGGSDYTLQGVTQLLSVPYALFAEKTNLIAGPGIKISKNMITAEFLPGRGIEIEGNVISTRQAWLLNGNGATTSANFLGTTDNRPVNFRTNNFQRFSIGQNNLIGSTNLVYISAGQESNFSTHPVQFTVYGKDMAGYTIPLSVAGSVVGMNWGPSTGSTNTLGRLIRLAQFTGTGSTQYQFYDVGIDQSGSYFIGEHQLWTDGNFAPKKLFTISPQDFVGVNFTWGQNPTANFHTKGTLRFEGINTNNALTRIVAMDASGNVSVRDASTLSGGGGGSGWSLTGNSGTTGLNFLGTSDNQQLKFRVNNKQRFHISPVTTVGTYNLSYITAGDSLVTSPNATQFIVNGKDISGSLLPMSINASIIGMNWSQTGGSNNTLGRLMRWTQWTSVTNNQFYDQGIDQEGDFFITEHGLSGTGGLLPKKMLQISNDNNVGINMDWAENPTANLHTKGTLRFEGVSINNALTRMLAMDANGNVSVRDVGTLGSSQWVSDANGIHNNSGNVGIGANSNTNAILNVMGNANFPYTFEVNSTNTWQSSLNLFNSTSPFKWYLVTGGSSNSETTYGVGSGNLGIAKENNASPGTTFPIIITSDEKVGIGMGLGGSNNVPKAQLHVKSGDIYIEDVTSGVIMKSPNGSCWRMTVSNAGSPVFTSIPCP